MGREGEFSSEKKDSNSYKEDEDLGIKNQIIEDGEVETEPKPKAQTRTEGKTDEIVMQVLKEEGEGLMLQYDSTGVNSGADQPVPQERLEVLQPFEAVFADIHDLPPRRRQDHAIHLREGAEIHYQETEIEMLVMEILQAGCAYRVFDEMTVREIISGKAERAKGSVSAAYASLLVQWDPGGCWQLSSPAWPSCFKQWDPGDLWLSNSLFFTLRTR